MSLSRARSSAWPQGLNQCTCWRTNFAARLSVPQSEMAGQLLKDPKLVVDDGINRE